MQLRDFVFAQTSIHTPPSLSVNPHGAAAFVAAVVCGLLLLQYGHRRRPFILLWAAGWLLIAPAMLLIARGYAAPWLAREAVGLSQLLGVYSAALFLWSGDVYRQTQLVQRRHGRWAAVVAAYFVISPLLLGTGAVTIPGYLLEAVTLGAAGSIYAAVLLERRMIGAGLIAFVLFGLAVSHVTTAFADRSTAGGEAFTYTMLMVNAILYTSGALGVHLLIFEDMTYELRVTNRRLEAAREELMQAAITDPLTGCHNRRFLDQVIDRELQRHARFRLPLSLLFIDIDRFKQVNDTLGHEAGDEVLRYVARFLKRRIREADYIFRWGGDEFLVLITCSGGEARRKAAGLKASFEPPAQTVELPSAIGLSVGWIEVPANTSDLMPLVREADARMYADKGHR